MRAELVPHPAAAPADLAITVEVERDGTELLLRFSISGAVHDIRLPPASAPAQRRDELWRHTCFEAFIRPARSEAYHELNLSPSNDWAFYHFEDWRAGRSNPDLPNLAFDCSDGPALIELRASLDLGTLVSPAVPWQLNLTTVIENRAGQLSYWALAHPDGAPDFHHPDCFILDLPPPAAA